MELCNEGHDEVCYERGGCPACWIIKEVEDLEKQLKVADQEIAELKALASDTDKI